MARCEYKYTKVVDIGAGHSQAYYVITEGDVAAGDETVVAANGINSTQSVTRYRRTSVLARGNVSCLTSQLTATMEALLKTHETRSRTAIDEQAS